MESVWSGKPVGWRRYVVGQGGIHAITLRALIGGRGIYNSLALGGGTVKMGVLFADFDLSRKDRTIREEVAHETQILLFMFFGYRYVRWVCGR